MTKVAQKCSHMKQCPYLFSRPLAVKGLHILSDYLRDFQSIARIAEKEEDNAKKELAKIGGIDGIDDLSEAALETMKNLYEFVEAMEVSNVTQ